MWPEGSTTSRLSGQVFWPLRDRNTDAYSNRCYCCYCLREVVHGCGCYALNAGLTKAECSRDRRQLGRTPSPFYRSCLSSDYVLIMGNKPSYWSYLINQIILFSVSKFQELSHQYKRLHKWFFSTCFWNRILDIILLSYSFIQAVLAKHIVQRPLAECEGTWGWRVRYLLS